MKDLMANAAVEGMARKFYDVINMRIIEFSKHMEKAQTMCNWYRYAECDTYLNALQQIKEDFAVVSGIRDKEDFD